MSIAVIKAKRDLNEGHWGKVIEKLSTKGVKVHFNTVPADTFIVLGGRFENPMALDGKRILFFHKAEWKPNHGYVGWDYWFGHLVKEYYHELYDCTKTDLDGVVNQIVRLISAEERTADKS